MYTYTMLKTNQHMHEYLLCQNDAGKCALMEAAEGGHVELVKRLLQVYVCI